MAGDTNIIVPASAPIATLTDDLALPALIANAGDQGK